MDDFFSSKDLPKDFRATNRSKICIQSHEYNSLSVRHSLPINSSSLLGFQVPNDNRDDILWSPLLSHHSSFCQSRCEVGFNLNFFLHMIHSGSDLSVFYTYTYMHNRPLQLFSQDYIIPLMLCTHDT